MYEGGGVSTALYQRCWYPLVVSIGGIRWWYPLVVSVGGIVIVIVSYRTCRLAHIARIAPRDRIHTTTTTGCRS